MTLVITGGRQYRDGNKLSQILLELAPTRILVGNATGADTLAKNWAKEHDIPCDVFKADWNKFGTAAGPIRNCEMLKTAQRLYDSVLVIAFPGGIGTENCIKQAKDLGLVVLRSDL